jgi:hypothetical protein
MQRLRLLDGVCPQGAGAKVIEASGGQLHRIQIALIAPATAGGL